MAFKRLVCLGDSIVEGFGDQQGIGWPGRIARRLIADNPDHAWAFGNLGVGGDTVVDGKHRVSGILTRDTTHVLLSYGTNDMSIMLWPDKSTGTKLSLPFAKQNWMRLLGQIKSMGIKVGVVGLLPVVESKFPFIYIACDENDHGLLFQNKHQLAYHNMVADVCRMYDIPFIDLFADWEKRDLERLHCDGLHPSTEGYDLLSDQIYSKLEEIDFFNEG